MVRLGSHLDTHISKEDRLSANSRLSDSHAVALGKLKDHTQFTPAKETGIHFATQKALVSRSFAVTDATGNKIKITAAGRKEYARASFKISKNATT